MAVDKYGRKVVDYRVKKDEFGRYVVAYDQDGRTYSAVGEPELKDNGSKETRKEITARLCGVLGISTDKLKK